MSDTNTCSVASCEGKVLARGWCTAHYKRYRRHGDPLGGVPSYARTPEEKFQRHTTRREGDCIVWDGPVTHNGYGVFSYGAGHARAHRYAWERVNGPIPDGIVVDHTCHNRACVNVSHMRLSTYKWNMENRKGANKNSTTGIRGVSWHEGTQKWRASVTHNRHNYYVGVFESVEEAERAVIAKRNELFTHNDRDRAA